MTMTLSGDGTITGLSAGGLPDGVVTAADLAAGAARANFGAGAVLQVVQTVKTDTFSTTSTLTYVDITNFSVTITPTSSNSKILVMVTLSGSGNSGASALLLRLMRDSTAIYLGDSSGNRIRATTSNMTSDNNVAQAISFTFLDSPATTSATTYKVQMCSTFNSNITTINRSITDVDASDRARTASSITAMEIAG